MSSHVTSAPTAKPKRSALQRLIDLPTTTLSPRTLDLLRRCLLAWQIAVDKLLPEPTDSAACDAYLQARAAETAALRDTQQPVQGP